MGTVVQTFEPLAGYNTGSVIAELYVPSSGPTLTPGWAFTAPGTNLEICFPSQAINYGGGNATIQIDWYCTAATSGTATWIAKVIAVTPGDAESVEASDNATSTTSSATTVNGTAGGLTRTTISVSALDSLAAGDKVWVKLRRDTSDTSIAQTIYLTELIFSYGDGLTGTPGSGDVVGPASATNNAIAKYDTTTGKLIQNSGIVIDASNNVTGLGTINMRVIADLVAGPASSTSGRIAVYNGTTGKLIQDGTKLEADVVAGPASATSGRIAVYNGTTGKLIQDGTKLEADVVTGPASVTTGRVAAFNGTTGKIIQQGTQLAADLVTGPASATSGNIAALDATGKVLSDSGVSATAHAPRHNIGGADTLFPGTWAADERSEWNGTIWVPKYNKIARLSSDTSFTGAANTYTDVAGLDVALPRAGTYKFVCTGALVTSGTAGHFASCVTYTGTVTSVHGVGYYALAGGATGFMYWTQVANGALASTTGAGTATNGTQSIFLSGIIVVSTAATLKWQLRRASASTTTTIKASTGIQVNES